MSKTISYLILFLFLSLQSVISQTHFIPLMVDHARFKSQPSRNYLEIYASLFQKDLSYLPLSQKFKAQYSLSLQIQQGDSIIEQQNKQIESIIDSLAAITADKQFVTLFAVDLPIGKYQAKITVEDLNSSGRGEYLCELQSRSYSEDSLNLSDIEFAYNISKPVSQSEFNKNSMFVLPNAADSYSVLTPVLYFYSEIYNLKYDPAVTGEYSSTCCITNPQGDTLRQFPVKIHEKPGTSALLVDGFNIVTLADGIYYLHLEVQDRQTTQLARQQKKFTYHKPVRKALAQTENPDNQDRETAIQSEYGQWDEYELDQEFTSAILIASEDEIRVYRTLDLAGKRDFLYQFWQKRNALRPDFKTDYFERVQLTESLFGSGRTKGWQTDRGRILLQYGKPDEWNKYYMEPDKKPYEIWIYHGIESGVQFVFADLQGFGEFELLHSTHSKELHNPTWQRLVTKAESSVSFDSGNDFQF